MGLAAAHHEFQQGQVVGCDCGKGHEDDSQRLAHAVADSPDQGSGQGGLEGPGGVRGLHRPGLEEAILLLGAGGQEPRHQRGRVGGMSAPGHWNLGGPRGTLIHTYTVNRGLLERAKLLVATQFNNAYINMLIRDLAEKHIEGNQLSQSGEWLIGHCIRLFDPCLSCATH